MRKRRVSLEEATKYLEGFKVFISGNKFNVLDGGKYHSGWTIVIPQEWELDENDQPVVPDIFEYRECSDLTNGMNIDFDGDCMVRFGNYHKSQSGRPVFEVTEPKKASHVMVRSNWGGPFDHTRGQTSMYASEIGVPEFVRSRSNGGGLGNDYYILPIDYINAPEKRNVQEIIDKEQEKLEKEREARSEKIEHIKAEREKALAVKEHVISEITSIINEHNENHEEKIRVTFKEYTVKYDWIYDSEKYYSEECIQDVKARVAELLKREEQMNEKESQKEEMIKRMAPYQEMLNGIEASITFNLDSFEVTFLTQELPKVSIHPFYHCEIISGGSDKQIYAYTNAGFISFIERLNVAVEDYKIRKNTERQKELETIAKAQKIVDEKEAKEKGYPSKFEYANRLAGATDISHAYVISSNGDIREPDDNILRNPNHRYHYRNLQECIANADGTQVYNQILPGEIILSYKKSCTREPFVIDIEWADGMPTEDQLEVMVGLLEKLVPEENPYGFFVCDADELRQEENPTAIVDFRAWLMKKIEEKKKECIKQLEETGKKSPISLTNIETNVEKNQNKENSTPQ